MIEGNEERVFKRRKTRSDKRPDHWEELEHLKKLKALGVELTYEDVRGVSPETLGRAHVADALRRKGVVPTRAEAFRRFLAQGRPAYVESLGPSVAEAIALVRGAGGFAVIAHPGTVADKEEIEGWHVRLQVAVFGIRRCLRKAGTLPPCHAA